MTRDTIRRKIIRRSFQGVQALEPRRLLAAVSWDGGAGTTAWTDANNWSTDTLPGVNDDVTIDVPAATTVTLGSGSQAINSLTCAEGLTINGTGTLSVAAASVVNGAFSLAAAGASVSGAGNLTLNGASAWTAGTMLAGGTTILGTAGTLAISAGTNLTLSRNLTIASGGIMNWSGAADLLLSNSTITNNGTINHTTTGTAIYTQTAGTNALINNATINKSASGTVQIAVPFTNASVGTLTATAGTLQFTGNIINSGAIAANGTTSLTFFANGTYNGGSSITGNANINFQGGTHALDAGRFSGTGNLAIQGPTNVTVNTPVGTINPTLSGTAVFNVPVTIAVPAISGSATFNQSATITGAAGISGTANFNSTTSFGSTLNVTGTATFSSTATFGGNVTVSGRLDSNTAAPGLSIPTLAVSSGVVGGTGLLVITNTLTSNGNMTMDSTGTTRLAAGATLPNVGNAWGIGGGRTFHNQGTVTMGSDNPDIYLSNGTFLNDGTLQSVNGTSLDQIVNDPGTNLFINNGTILKTVGATTAVLSIEVPFQHNGLIDVGPGTVNISGAGSTYAASSTTAGSGNINFNGGSHTFLGATTLNGISAAGFPFFTGGTAIFNVDTTISNGRFGGSTVEGAGTLSLGNGTQVYSGNFATTGGGRLRVPAGTTAAFNGNNPVVARPLDIFGTLQMPTGGDLNVFNTVITVEVGGTLHFNMSAGGSDIEFASGATSGSVVNKGTVLRDSTGSATIGVRFDNQGLVDCNGGTLAIGGGFADGTYTRTTGIYDVQTATLNFGTVNTNGAEVIARAGAVINGMSNLQYNDGKFDLRDGIDWAFDPFASQGNTMYNRGQIELSPGSVFSIAAGNNLVFAGTGNATIRSEIAGPTDAEYGRLFVGGQLRLASPDGGDSQFDPDLVGGYDPATGTKFNIVTANTIVDSFDDFFGATTPSGKILLAGKDTTHVFAEVGTGTPPPAPQILSSNYDYLTRQAVVVGFNVDVSAFLSRKDMSLVNLTTNTTVSPDIGQLTYDSANSTATLTLTNLLADGNYRLSITADDIANAAGIPLTTPLTIHFQVLRGDANLDHHVDFADLVILAQNYNLTGRTFIQGDFNYSGATNFDDLVILAQKYNSSLPALATPVIATKKVKKSVVGELL